MYYCQNYAGTLGLSLPAKSYEAITTGAYTNIVLIIYVILLKCATMCSTYATTK